MKKNHSATIAYFGISIASLLVFIALRIINDPDKYSWCNEHGWAAGVGNCFNLGIEHFAIDALSMLSLGTFVAFVILAIIAYIKKPKKR